MGGIGRQLARIRSDGRAPATHGLPHPLCPGLGIGGGRVLRARTPSGIDQEPYTLLVTSQLLRLAVSDATSTRPGLDPDRAGFTVALNAARDPVVQAAGVFDSTSVDLICVIARRVLAHPMPVRRVRTRPRVVKRAISKYNARGGIDRTTCNATVGIDILAALTA